MFLRDKLVGDIEEEEDIDVNDETGEGEDEDVNIDIDDKMLEELLGNEDDV